MQISCDVGLKTQSFTEQVCLGLHHTRHCLIHNKTNMPYHNWTLRGDTLTKIVSFSISSKVFREVQIHTLPPPIPLPHLCPPPRF